MIANSESLGVQFRKYRKQQGLSQRRVSQLSGVAQDKISKFENGNRNIRISTLFRLLDVLNLRLVVIDENGDEI